MSKPRVFTAQEADKKNIISAIVLAFVNDPITRWLWPNSADYLKYQPELATAFGGRAFENGSAHYSENYAGGALWLPPGVEPDQAAMARILQESLPPDRLKIAFEALEQMASFHPQGPHWYLALIGVDPAQYGRGHGSAMTRFALERVDRDGLPAYLESSNPANISLYERFGFQVTGSLAVADAPKMYPMIRP